MRVKEREAIIVPHQKGVKSVAQNRKAWHDYFVEDRYECGLALFGTEVKSIRQGRVNLKESWAHVRGGERCQAGRGPGHPPRAAGKQPPLRTSKGRSCKISANGEEKTAPCAL